MSDHSRNFSLANTAEIERAGFVVICDAEGSLVELSAAGRRFTGASPAHYSGFRWLELVHRDERDKIVELIGDASAAVTPQRCRIRRFDGEFRWFQILVEPRSWSVIDERHPEPRQVNERVVLTAIEVDSES